MKNLPPLAKAGWLAIALALVFVLGWEYYLRSQGYRLSYNNNEPLWAYQRSRVYLPPDKATVFIGSSRIKFDLDIPTWEQQTGESAIQLAMEGTSPRQMLKNLGDDEAFRGKLVVDVTEDLFFSPDGQRPDAGAVKSIKYYQQESPTQKFGFQVNRLAESGFVFLESRSFSVKALLDDLHLPNRKGVFDMPQFPKKFTTVAFSRQTSFTEAFVADTALQNKVKTIWTIYGTFSKQKGVGGDTLDAIFKQVAVAVAKIKERGGNVVFVRTPSNNPELENEKIRYPRPLYWDRLLKESHCEGIHFEDYPVTAHFTCPEWSHLTPSDGRLYTAALAGILKKEKNWFTPPH